MNKLNATDKNPLSKIQSLNKEKANKHEDKSKIQYELLSNKIIELKKFIYLEIKKVRQDLQRVLVLIPKKAQIQQYISDT